MTGFAQGRTIMLDYPRIAEHLVCIFCGWPRRTSDSETGPTLSTLADHFAREHGRVVV